MARNRKENNVTVGIGIPTILMLFIILAMVILSLLGYLKEENNTKIVKREIEYNRNYYIADSKAKYIIDNLDDDEYINKECLNFVKEDGKISFVIDVDEKRILSIVVENDRIIEYKLKARGE